VGEYYKKVINGVSVQFIKVMPFNDDKLGFLRIEQPLEAVVSINGGAPLVVGGCIKGIMIYELEPIGFDDIYYDHFYNCQEDKTNTLYRMYIGARKPKPVNLT
jgi:hypothetical protein